jgi:hypothetical protein
LAGFGKGDLAGLGPGVLSLIAMAQLIVRNLTIQVVVSCRLVSGWLLDTNVVSELRKRERANANVLAWYAAVDGEALWLSVLVLGEIRRGIESLRRRDERSARALDRWMVRLERQRGSHILAVDLNTKHVARTGVQCVDPFAPRG